ncbi:unnamed protein product [Effrenium voratum]|nr:unnamed protein product [Effrenium voratum]
MGDGKSSRIRKAAFETWRRVLGVDRRILNANTARPKVPRGWTLAQEAMEAWGSPAKRPRVRVSEFAEFRPLAGEREAYGRPANKRDLGHRCYHCRRPFSLLGAELVAELQGGPTQRYHPECWRPSRRRAPLRRRHTTDEGCSSSEVLWAMQVNQDNMGQCSQMCRSFRFQTPTGTASLLSFAEWHLAKEFSEEVTAEAMRELKAKVGRLAENTGLPAIIYEGDKYTLVYRDFLMQNECPAARWTVELLAAQLATQRLRAAASAAEAAEALAWGLGPVPEVLNLGQGVEGGAMFWPGCHLQTKTALLWGNGATWPAVARGNWGTFALLASLSREFQRLLGGEGEDAGYLLPMLRERLLKDSKELEHAEQLPDLLAANLELLRSVNRSDSSWPSLAKTARHVEDSLRDWSRRALMSGLQVGTVVALLLQGGAFWRALDALLLPDYVQLCLPQALNTLDVPPESSPCRLRHCRHFWGASSLQAAQVNWTEAIFKVEPRRRLLSDNLRSDCRLTCSPRVLQVLQAAQSLPRFRYVDVGAAMGDCMMVASFFLSQRLTGVSFEPLPGHAQSARKTFMLNGRRNLRLRWQALGRQSGRIQGQVFHGGFGHQVKGTPLSVPSTTLDKALSLRGEFIDLLTIFVNHWEADVLDGASTLLRRKQIGCVLVCSYGFANFTSAAAERLLGFGYAVAGLTHGLEPNGFEWVRGCPPSDVGCCDEPFFRWRCQQ